MRLGPLGAALVGNDGVTAMIRHHDILYGDLRDPLALLAGRGAAASCSATGPMPAASAARTPSPRRHADYTALMAASQAFVTARDPRRLSRSARHKRLLDVGGGDATFLIAAGTRAPELTLVALRPAAGRRASPASGCWPPGSPVAPRPMAAAFFDDPLPAGRRSRHAEPRAARPRRCGGARDPQGGAAAPSRRTERCWSPSRWPARRAPQASGDAYFGFYLLAMGQGRPRTFEEIAGLLRQGRIRPHQPGPDQHAAHRADRLGAPRARCLSRLSRWPDTMTVQFN